MKLFAYINQDIKVGKNLPFEGYNMATKTTILESILRKQPSTRKSYRVALIVPDNGIPYIEYQQLNSFPPRSRPVKLIDFTDLLFADKKHEKANKFAFSVYTTDKTLVFLAPDENTMTEWVNQIKDQHLSLFPDFKRYTAVFEAKILERGLGESMKLQGPYRLALCKDSLDLIPILATTTVQPDVDCASIKNEMKSEQKKLSKKGGESKGNDNVNSDLIAKTTSNTANTTTSANPSSVVTLSDKSDKITSPATSTTTNENNTNNTKSSSGTDDSVKLQDVPDRLDSAETHPIHPRPRRNQQKFQKLHPLLSSKTIELVLRSLRRCGHTDNQFYIEPGRHSQTGQGDLWMVMNKKATARILHDKLLNAMNASANISDNFPQSHKSSRSRSGSSNENGLKLQQARSSSQICLSTNSPSDTHVVAGSPRSLINQFISNCNIGNGDSNSDLVTTTTTPTPGTSFTLNNSIISSTPTSTTLSTTEENDGYIQMA